VLSQYEPREVEDALLSLPITLEAAYNDIMYRIEKRAAGVLRLALKALFWVLNAAQPLRIEELCELLVVRPGDNGFQDRHRLQPHQIIDACQSLIVYDQDERFVRFTHFTVKEYLSNYDFQKYLNPAPSLAEVCLTYLAFDCFDSGPVKLIQRSGRLLEFDTGLLDQRLEEYKACQYAACCWEAHTREEEDSPLIQEAVLALLENRRKRGSMLQMKIYDQKSTWYLYLSKQLDCLEGRCLLHHLAEAGLASICTRVLWGISCVKYE
jgi:hypothetical protein